MHSRHGPRATRELTPSCLEIWDREVSKTRVATPASGLIVPSCFACSTFRIAVCTHVICAHMTKIFISGPESASFSQIYWEVGEMGLKAWSPKVSYERFLVLPSWYLALQLLLPSQARTIQSKGPWKPEKWADCAGHWPATDSSVHIHKHSGPCSSMLCDRHSTVFSSVVHTRKRICTENSFVNMTLQPRDVHREKLQALSI